MNAASVTRARWIPDFRTRLTIGLILLATISSAFILITANINFRLYSRSIFRQRLLELVTIAALQQEGDAFMTIQSPNDAEFERVRIQNLAIRRSSPDIRFLYTLRFDEEGLYFVVDAGELGEEDISVYGERYPDAGPTLARNYRTLNKPMVEEEFYTDSYGTFLSAYAPILTSNGELAGIIAIDFTATRVLEVERRLFYITLTIFGAFLPIIAGFGWFLGNILAKPIQALTQVAARSAQGDFSYRSSIRTTIPEILSLDRAFAMMTEQIREQIGTLETRVAVRTAELDAANSRNERRARQFEAIAGISRVISQTQNLDTLLSQVTEMISQQFDVYHTGIFLMDANFEYAVLIAANSPGGKRMLERSHKLKAGQTGIVGYAAGSGLPRIALDTGADAIYFNNPDLPETRSEMALPLFRKGGQVIGVLDVQSREANAFSQEDVRVLTTLADQVAIAIENARLFEDQERILNETQAIYSQDLREGWARFTRSKNIAGIQRRNLKTTILPEPQELPGGMESARSGIVYRKTEADGSSIFTIAIKLREQVVGILNVRSVSSRAWSDDEIDIASAIVQRAALSIENARLLEESRNAVKREHAISEISTRISAGTQIEDILRTAAQELGAQINGAQVTLEIGGGG